MVIEGGILISCWLLGYYITSKGDSQIYIVFLYVLGYFCQ